MHSQHLPSALCGTFILIKCLVVIFQASLHSAVLPFDWKVARVVPILKKVDPSSVLNYHPISMLSSSCKLIEHIVADYINDFLNKHNILSPFQNGFRKALSTVTQLSTVNHSFASVLDKAGQLDMIFLDFQKAFDVVPHDKLICKLEFLGLPGFILSWVSAYLTHRKQDVVIDGQQSNSFSNLWRASRQRAWPTTISYLL